MGLDVCEFFNAIAIPSVHDMLLAFKRFHVQKIVYSLLTYSI